MDEIPERELIRRTVHRVARNLCAIHDAAVTAQCSPQDADSILELVRETARSSARALDVLAEKVDGDFPRLGCYSDPLSDD